jgi:hypothetical protein
MMPQPKKKKVKKKPKRHARHKAHKPHARAKRAAPKKRKVKKGAPRTRGGELTARERAALTKAFRPRRSREGVAGCKAFIAKRTPPSVGGFDEWSPEDRADDLVLWIENDGDLYRQQHVPIQKNLRAKMARGTYDSDKAVKLFMYLVENGAKHYVRDTNGGKWHVAFPKSTREIAARELRDRYERAARDGEYDEYLPKKYAGHKVGGEVDVYTSTVEGERPLTGTANATVVADARREAKRWVGPVARGDTSPEVAWNSSGVGYPYMDAATARVAREAFMRELRRGGAMGADDEVGAKPIRTATIDHPMQRGNVIALAEQRASDERWTVRLAAADPGSFRKMTRRQIEAVRYGDTADASGAFKYVSDARDAVMAHHRKSPLTGYPLAGRHTTRPRKRSEYVGEGPTPKVEALYHAAMRADKAYHDALVEWVGPKKAGDARYLPMREKPPEVQRLSEANRAAYEAYREAAREMRAQRGGSSVQGRHYSNDEWLEFFIEGEAESMGVECPNPEPSKSTMELGNVFIDAVQEALEDLPPDWFRSDAARGELLERDDLHIDVLFTLQGAGVGIWDGRWDGAFDERNLERVQKRLKGSLGRFADDSGGGALPEAFMLDAERCSNGNGSDGVGAAIAMPVHRALRYAMPLLGRMRS